jgi:two-component system, LytTR family, response regulator
MRAIIIDDEENCSELTLNLLQEYCRTIDVLHVANSVESGFSAIQKYKPELVFLDVQMQDGTGFDLLSKFKGIDFKIVFITAYQEFALNALKQSAIDYLLKPLSPPDIINAVKKVEASFDNSGWNAQLKTLLGNLAEPIPNRQKIVLKTMERIYSLHLNDIIRFQSEGSYTEVYLKEGKRIMVSRLLKEFDDILSKDGFIRVHQSHLINEDFIFCFEKSENSITMKDNSVVPVSVRKKEQLLSLLNSI